MRGEERGGGRNPLSAFPLERRRALFFRISDNPFNFYPERREMKKGGRVEQAEET